MKTDFSINVQVNLGVAPEIVALVNAILRHRPTIAPSDEEALNGNGQVDNNPEPTKEAAGEELEAAAKTEEAAPQDEGQAKAQAEAGQKPLTAEDVRAAMHKTRQRIEGEDYKENTTGEAYKKYHKPLTAQFKNIAALLGADKPSALPPDKIASFIKQCDELQIMEDGTIGTKCPY